MSRESSIQETDASRHWLMGLLLLAAVGLAYQQVWHAGFIWDDDTFLLKNPLIHAANGLYRFWFTTRAPDYFPLTSTSLWLEWRLWGENPLGYHLTNLLLHSASALLLWRVLARLRIPGAWLAAAVFALHPVNVDSVAWITERKNTLPMFFYAAALLWYLRFEDTARRRWYWLGVGAFALALLSKTAVVTLPVVLLGLAWWRRGVIRRRDLWRSLPFFALAAVMGLVTVWFQYHRAIGSEIVRTDSLGSRLAIAGWALWFYLSKALLPINLMFVYPRWPVNAQTVLSFAPGLLFGALLLVCWIYRWQPLGRAGLACLGYFAVMLLPVLGFLEIYFMRYSLVADHWQYFSILGPIVLVVAALTTGLDACGGAMPLLKPVINGSVLILLGILTWRQCGMYLDVETLWRNTIARNPECWLAYNNLGVVMYNKGRFEEADAHYREALQLKPDYAEAHDNVGNSLLRQGRTEEAIVQYREALRIEPSHSAAHNNLGNALLRQGRTDEAIVQYREALWINPDYADAHSDLGSAMFLKGQLEEAIAQYREALRINPAYADAHNNLGSAMFQQGRIEEAIVQYRETLRINPSHTDARNNLATALHQQGHQERTDEGGKRTQKAIMPQPANLGHPK